MLNPDTPISEWDKLLSLTSNIIVSLILKHKIMLIMIKLLFTHRDSFIDFLLYLVFAHVCMYFYLKVVFHHID